MQRRAVIIGAMGQDGYYLSALLERVGYQVVGIGRDVLKTGRDERRFDVLDFHQVSDLIMELRPQEIYYLAAHHHSSQEQIAGVPDLFAESFRVHCLGLANVLEAIKIHSSRSRVFYAASSLVFGEPASAPQSEQTPFSPICIYGITKVAGIDLCRMYRRDHGIFCCAGILYNHESPRRPEKFITRKLVKAAVAASRGQLAKVTVGNLSGQVDWTAAEDTVRAMHAMLQLDAPEEFVVASGEAHTVREAAELAYSLVGLDYRNFLEESETVLHRPTRRVPLVGDSSLLRKRAGWRTEISFEQMLEAMVRAELGADE
jgi:GDPmannose 4,6-dehydratase